MMRRLFLIVGLLLLPQLAWAGTCSNTLSMKDGGGSTVTLAESTDGTNLAPCVSQIGATPTSGTLQSSAVASGNGTNLVTTGMATAVLTVNCATCSGGTTVNFEGTQDGSNFTSLNAQLLGSTTIATSTTTAGVTVWEMAVNNLSAVRARISGYSAGTVTVTGATTAMPASPRNVNVAGGSLAANQSVNVAQVNGVTTLANAGAVGTGSQRVAVGQDTTTIAGSAPGTAGSASSNVVTIQGIASMTKLLVTPDANSAVNVAQINGVTPLMGNGVTGTGSPRVTIASDNTAIAAAGQVATGAAPPTGSTYVGTLQSGATGGHVGGIIQCDNHVFKHITSATDTFAITGVASQTIKICSWRSRAAGVATWYLEDVSTTSDCTGTKTQLNGVATEAANTGETWGTAFYSGLQNTAGHGLCINSTGTGGVDVDIWFTQF